MKHQARRWPLPILLTVSFLLGIGARTASGQESGTVTHPDATQNVPVAQQGSVKTDRIVSLPRLPGNILEDQKEIFLFPRDLAKGKHWWPTIGVLGGTAALVASDPYTAPPFRTTTRFKGFNRDLSSVNTAAFIAAVPAAMYGVGWLRKDFYAKETALLAGEAVADGFLLDIPFKGITGRKQPLNYAGNGPYADSYFDGSHNPFHSGGFFSEHAFAATAVATVFAHRYRKHRWVPFVAYGLAGAICFSRISRSEHFPGDVFFGGAMGIVIAKYAVLPARN
jgi:membrane-associated phospholipid phosphatase